MTNLENNLLFCLAICAHDGLISQREEECLFELFTEYYSVDRKNFDLIIDKFFESNSTLEDLAFRISDHKLVLSWAEKAAQADGLDIRENIALQKSSQLLQ